MYAIHIVDSDWFDRIEDAPTNQRINLWQPTPRRIRELRYGDRLYFMLKEPDRKIAGYGSFVRWCQMNAIEAWNEYGTGNGVDSKEELVFKVESYAEKRSRNFIRTGNPVIGCIELVGIATLSRSVSDTECGISFDPHNPRLKYFYGDDVIEARASQPLHVISAEAIPC
jgi:hypothetical protein